MGSYVGGATATAVSSQEALLDHTSDATSSGWTLKELAGAILFAGASATAASMMLGPIADKWGSPGGGGGGGGYGGNSGGPPPAGGKNENAFETLAKEKEGDEKELGLGFASIQRPYEVCNCIIKCLCEVMYTSNASTFVISLSRSLSEHYGVDASRWKMNM